MNLTERRLAFREVLEGDRVVHPGSVYDPISARIAEDLGFKIGMFAGSIASATVLGAPDYIVLTMTEFAQQAHRICRAGTLPLLVDADHGYGNALNVKRTVEELETAGVSALTIEDTSLPRGFGVRDQTLISLDEGVGKMKAALEGRQDPSLVVAGRTGALAIESPRETIRRIQAYERAGVDAIFLVGLETKEQLEMVSAEITIPILMGGGKADLADLEYLAAHGVRVALQGHQPFMAAVKAAYDTLKALKEGTLPTDLRDRIASDGLIAEVTRRGSYDCWTKEFLT